MHYQRDNAAEDEQEDGMTIDVSAGGLAMYLNDVPDVGEALQVQLPPVRVNGERHELPVPDLWYCVLVAPRLLRAACTVMRAVCRSATPTTCEREAVKEYMGYVRAKYKI